VADPIRPCPDDTTLLQLALGELAGRDRADVLVHVGDCPTCRRRVQAVVEAVEQVLLTAPEAEPPTGFEAAVLGRLAADPPRGRRRTVRILMAAAAAVLVTLATVIGYGLGHQGQPSELAETAMVTPAGRDVGRAWRYESEPTWVLVSVPRWQAWERSTRHEYRLHARLDDGRVTDLGPLEFATSTGAWGATTEIDARRIRAVSVVDAAGHVWCEGEF
jgi:hypothetical protein